MLFLNDVFKLEGTRHRLLNVDTETKTAWTLNLDDSAAWPVARTWPSIRELPALALDRTSKPPDAAPSPAMSARRDAAMQRLAPILKAVPAVFDACNRSALVKSTALELGCTRTTLYNDLRRWWRGGQTPSALLANYHRCGDSTPPGTATRGRPGQSPHYQVTESDLAKFKSLAENHYLADGRVSMRHSYQRLLERHYTTEDGNGDPFIREPGERPSFRQFEHFIYSRYPLEARLRKRKGDKDFEREHRGKLGTVLEDCLGVGHYYEADATIADVYLVAADDVRKIIGKPTLYFIVDRKSRLITGFYVGLENPSWICAMQAILSISQNKAEICARYNVPYHPADWPAHAVFPKQFLADRGEMLTRASSQLADELAITVTNVPSKRADWKPVVECGFKLQRRALEDGIPGFDPPENAKKRQGKKYDRDACLTLSQFTTIILNSIIAHNRAPMPFYDLSLKELGDDVVPSPIALWNHGIVERAGLLTRYEEERVRMALLPRAEATVSEEGILLNGCHYTCQAALDGGWFVQARRKRFKLLAIYDSRMVDIAYVQNPHRREEIHTCTLTPRSEKFRGMSVKEVEAIQRIERRLQPSIGQGRHQATADMNRKNDAVAAVARESLKKLGRIPARTSRRADTKEARTEELRTERQAAVAGVMPGNPQPNGSPADVVALHRKRGVSKPKPPPATPASTEDDNVQGMVAEQAAETMSQRLQRMREQMRNG